jgi:hypothetical protein
MSICHIDSRVHKSHDESSGFPILKLPRVIRFKHALATLEELVQAGVA